MVNLDLSELDTVFDKHLCWSTRKPALAWFRREDHFGSPAESLDQSIRQLIESRGHTPPTGRIELLTNLRYFGYVMNPVSFYLCHDESNQLATVVAEVHNTPWNERYCYVLGPDEFDHNRPPEDCIRIPKQFHVSPFMPMDMEYRWRVKCQESSLEVRIENFREQSRQFDVVMKLKRREINRANLARALIRHPMMSGQTVAKIYWQAFRLWRKQIPFFPHPKHSQSTN